MAQSNQGSDRLAYIQLKEWLEDEILAGSFSQNTQIPSVAELSVSFKLNHITVLKSINLLADKEIIYKKRGVGMFVCEGAAEKIRAERQDDFYDKYVASMVSAAKKLGISLEELQRMTERGYNNE